MTLCNQPVAHLLGDVLLRPSDERACRDLAHHPVCRVRGEAQRLDLLRVLDRAQR